MKWLQRLSQSPSRKAARENRHSLQLGISDGEDDKRVLCIDTDPQGNLTSALSDGQGEIAGGMYDGKALYDMFTGFRYTNTKDYITETEYGDNVQMIPASSQTPRINQRMPELFEDATIIAKKDSSKQIASIADFLYYFLSQVRDEYDYILIDTQPTRDSLLLTNAINAADYVLIPTMCEANSQNPLSVPLRSATSCAIRREAV